MSNATVVTGIGVVAPNGLGTEDYWKATLAGESAASARSPGSTPRGIRRGWPARCRASTPRSTSPAGCMPQTDHMTRLALAAADWALADAGVDTGALARVRHGRGHGQPSGGLSSSASASCRTCGARAASTSAPTSPSPGSTRSTPARSPSGTACAVRAACWSPSRPAASTRSAQARRHVRRAPGWWSPAAWTRALPVGLARRSSPAGRLSTEPRPGARLPALRPPRPPATCRARAARSWSSRTRRPPRERGAAARLRRDRRVRAPPSTRRPGAAGRRPAPGRPHRARRRRAHRGRHRRRLRRRRRRARTWTGPRPPRSGGRSARAACR